MGFKETGGGSVRYTGWTCDVESQAINQFAVDPSKDIGGHRQRWIEQDVPFCKCCCFSCGTKKEKVKLDAQTIQPPAATMDARKKMMAKREATKKAPVVVERMEISNEADYVKMQSLRPMSPKGPMGGTFSAGFGRAQTADPNSMVATPMQPPASPLAGFRPGSPGMMNATMAGFRPGTAMRLSGQDPMKPDVVPGSPDSPVQFSESTGQPLAERHRAVSRAPAPDRRRKGTGIDIQKSNW